MAAHETRNFGLMLPVFVLRWRELHAKNSLKILGREALQITPVLLVGAGCGTLRSTNTSGALQDFFGQV